MNVIPKFYGKNYPRQFNLPLKSIYQKYNIS